MLTSGIFQNCKHLIFQYVCHSSKFQVPYKWEFQPCSFCENLPLVYRMTSSSQQKSVWDLSYKRPNQNQPNGAVNFCLAAANNPNQYKRNEETNIHIKQTLTYKNFTNMLAGFRSLWTIPRPCRYCNALAGTKEYTNSKPIIHMTTLLCSSKSQKQKSHIH